MLSRRCAFWDGTASFHFSRNLSQEADYRTSHLSKAYLERRWRSTEVPQGVALLAEKEEKKSKRKTFPRLTLDCLIFSRVHLVKPRIMLREKFEHGELFEATYIDFLSLINFMRMIDIAETNLWLDYSYIIFFPILIRSEIKLFLANEIHGYLIF